MDPERGYPESAQLALAAVAAGADPLLTGRLAFPGGSFANGGAMRIAPLGIAFRRAGDAQLRFAVRCAVVSSHVHAQGVDGAVVVAKAIALLVAVDAPAAFRPLAFLDALLGVAKTAPMRRKLATLRRHFAGAEGGGDGDGAPRADPASALWPAVAFSLAERDETGADRPRPCGGGARGARTTSCARGRGSRSARRPRSRAPWGVPRPVARARGGARRRGRARRRRGHGRRDVRRDVAARCTVTRGCRRDGWARSRIGRTTARRTPRAPRARSRRST